MGSCTFALLLHKKCLGISISLISRLDITVVGDPQVDAQVCIRGTREFKAREWAKLDDQFLGYVGQGMKLGTWLMHEGKIEEKRVRA